MSSPKRAWTVFVGVGVVEALKDQGLCRWNSGFKSAQQSVKSHVGSFSQAKKLSSSSSAVVSSKMHEENATLSEESLRKVMYLSCWGPSWRKEKDNMEKTFLFFECGPWRNCATSRRKCLLPCLVCIHLYHYYCYLFIVTVIMKNINSVNFCFPFTNIAYLHSIV